MLLAFGKFVGIPSFSCGICDLAQPPLLKGRGIEEGKENEGRIQRRERRGEGEREGEQGREGGMEGRRRGKKEGSGRLDKEGCTKGRLDLGQEGEMCVIMNNIYSNEHQVSVILVSARLRNIVL